jgi:DNA-binding MarR family transcriptional regulator
MVTPMDEAEVSQLPTPALMRAARGAYAQAIRAQLHAMGIDDLPRNGAFVLSAIDDTDGTLPDLPADIGITKQAVSQLVDTLVHRGYLERSPDADDRRRIVLELTDSGRQVVYAVQRAVDAVDEKLLERVSSEEVRAMRSGLLSLARIKSAAVTAGAGRRRPVRQFLRFSPVFPVRDLAAALAHYSALGFDTFGYESGDDYGFARREGVGLHLAAERDPEHEHVHVGSAYLHVSDADALYAEWSRPEIGGHTEPVQAMPYKLREGAHTDPDGNVIRFGSPIDE